FVAPVVMLTAAMTEPTPMMMPSMVRIERSLFRRNARMAKRIVARTLMRVERPAAPRAIFAIRFPQSADFFRFVGQNFSVAQNHRAFGVTGNVQFMRDHDDGNS